MDWSHALCRSLRTRRAQVLRLALRRTGAGLSAMDRYKTKHGKRGLPSQAGWFHGVDGNGSLQTSPPGPGALPGASSTQVGSNNGVRHVEVRWPRLRQPNVMATKPPQTPLVTPGGHENERVSL